MMMLKLLYCKYVIDQDNADLKTPLLQTCNRVKILTHLKAMLDTYTTFGIYVLRILIACACTSLFYNPIAN